MDSFGLENTQSVEKAKTQGHSSNTEQGGLLTVNDGESGVMLKGMNQKADLPSNLLLHTSSCQSLKETAKRTGTMPCRDFISAIPYRLSTYLLGYVDAFTVLQMGQTSKYWKVVSGDHDLWKRLFTNNGWKYDEEAIDNYLTHGKLSNRPLLRQHGVDCDDDIQSYHYFTLHDQRLINWKRLYRNRTLIEKRWRQGNYRMHKLSATLPNTATSPSSENDNDDYDKLGSMKFINNACIYCLQFDRNILVAGGRDRTLKIWSMETASYLDTLSGHNGSILCLQFEGNRLISGSSDCSVIIWDISTRTKLQVLEGHSESVLAIHFIGSRLVSGSKDRTIRIWDLDTGSTTHILTGHRASVNAIKLKNDRIVSASGDRSIRLWNACTGDLIRTFDFHLRGVACIDFDGDHIISGSSDNTIKVFDSATGDCLRTLTGHTSLVRTLQWDSLLDRVISGSYDGNINIWNTKNGTVLHTLGDKLEKK